ncbi:hypothetical protein ZHAS_00002118 [Anopheles sinensis]|uniref:Uncharacterized protein n=1 Tax=Anopheles sinensis TaxID=74873 RepID=A0A084VBU1_ANOSI|nr:hypothetical protein ZHAS_00002118 [Anopheles sinensis]
MNGNGTGSNAICASFALPLHRIGLHFRQRGGSRGHRAKAVKKTRLDGGKVLRDAFVLDTTFRGCRFVKSSDEAERMNFCREKKG